MRLQRRLYKICLVRFLHLRCLVGQNCLISVPNNLVDHQNNYLNAETKNKLKIKFFVVFTVSSFSGNPVFHCYPTGNKDDIEVVCQFPCLLGHSAVYSGNQKTV